MQAKDGLNIESNYSSGPKLNMSKYNSIIGQDHLGIRYVAVNIANSLLPGITTITPRARYWSFFAWVLYDFIENSPNKSLKKFKEFLKIQECFFIAANIAASEKYGLNIDGLQGVTRIQLLWSNNNSHIDYVNDYLQNSFVGYAAYRNVMKITGVTEDGDLSQKIEIDRLKPLGKELALAFKSEIEETTYYKNFRTGQLSVPKDILLEYGGKVSLSDAQDTADGEILRKIFLSEGHTLKTNRTDSLRYFKYILENNPTNKARDVYWYNALYNIYSPLGESFKGIEEEFKSIALGWEVFQGRQYFTFGLEGIWKVVLKKLENSSMSRQNLLSSILEKANFGHHSINSKLSDLMPEIPLSKQKVDEILAYLRDNGNDGKRSIHLSLLLMLEVYKRFKNRTDLDEYHHNILLEMGGKPNLSLSYWFKIVEKYYNSNLNEVIGFIINNLLINQHLRVALEKILYTNNDTYHFIEDEGILYGKLLDYPTFNSLRILEGITIAKDIGLITE